MVAVLAFNHKRGRTATLRYRFANELRSNDARVSNFTAVRSIVTTVHTATSEIDHHVGRLHAFAPWAKLIRIPMNCLPLPRFRVTRNGSDEVILFVKVAGENGSQMTAAARDDDL